MRKFGFLVLAISFAVFGLSACKKKVKTEYIAPGSTVVVIGDSITAAYGYNRDKSWVNILAKSTNWNVINAGISGDTAREAKNRIVPLLEQHNPQAVIIELGGNDMLGGASNNEISENLRELIHQVKLVDAIPILIAVPKPSAFGQIVSFLSDADFYEKLAEEENVILIEDAISSVLSDKDLRLDNLHPNEAGHIILGNKVVAQIKELNLF